MSHGLTPTRTVSTSEIQSQFAGLLAELNLDAYFLPPEDEHLNEYLPEYKKRIEWATGFTGENAPLVISRDRMFLYVDGRFHIQVDEEVDADVVQAIKLTAQGLGEQARQIYNNLRPLAAGGKTLRIGYDPFTLSPARMKSLEREIPADLSVNWVAIEGNLVDRLWTQRPAASNKPAFLLPESVTGRSTTDKLAAIRAKLRELNVDVLPITQLDDIAWLYNLRGGDIPYNPVLESYAVLAQDSATLFAPPEKIPPEMRTALENQDIRVLDYADYPHTLSELLDPANGKKRRVLADQGAMTLGTLNLISEKAEAVEGSNPITLEKAIKNPTEIEGMKRANFQASRAIIRHLAAMHRAFTEGKTLSEVDVRADLEAKYREEPDFHELSFPTIPGIAENSAIIHYSKADPGQVAKNGDFYLLDSGAQYLGGTTDTTRTTVFGTPTDLQKDRFTMVLKAHIDCARYRFPEGATGQQMDAIARNPLYQRGLDYGHGTGHGVGAFLNVHEGPNRISKINSTVFQPGMVTSIEPGYYEKGWGGIRLENLYYVAVDSVELAGGASRWFCFKPLTFVPFEKRLIDFNLLSPEQMDWLRSYYALILEAMSRTLNDAELAWLKDQCQIPALRVVLTD